MAEIIGNIDSLGGKFYARAEDGSLRELSQGDAIYQGEIVIGDNLNQSIDRIIVAMNDGYNIVLRANQSQAFDATLYENEFAENETVTETNTILSMLEESGDLTQEDIEEIETAAGEEGGAESTEGGPAVFAQSNGAFTDVNANVRDANMAGSEQGTAGKLDQYEELRRAAANSLTDPVEDATITIDTDITTTVTDPDTIAPDAPTNVESDGTTVTGSGEAGTTVAVTDPNGDTIGSGTVGEDGTFTVTLDTPQTNGEDLEVTLTDEAGNESETTSVTTPDTTAPETPVVTIDDLTNDNTPSVKVATETGATVVVTDQDGNELGSGVADENGDVTIAVSELPDGENALTVTVTDEAGNSTSTEVTTTVDTTADAGTVTINDIAGDNVLNATEAGQDNTTVSGTATGGDITDGDTVTVTVNGNDYTTTVDEDGNYSVEVPTSDVIADGTVDVSVASSDAAGNTVTSETTATVAVTVDEDIATPTITVAGDENKDGVINANELNPDGTVTVAISVTGSEVGDTLVYTVDGEETTLTLTEDDIANGVSIDVDPEATIEATLSDEAGNESSTVTQNLAETITVDTEASLPPVITNIVDTHGDYSEVILHGSGVAGESITLYARANATTAGNNTQTGDYVAVATTTVAENGTWRVDVSNLADVPVNDNEFFKATQTDVAGNVSESSNVVHYWHGEWSNVSTEGGDDFVLAGAGNDTIRVSGNDTNDRLVIDGGDGADTIIFNGKLEDYLITTNEEGHLNLTYKSDSTGDVTELINVESVSFADGIYTIDEMLLRAEDTSASVPTLELNIGDAEVIVDTQEFVNEDLTTATGIYERDGLYYKTEIEAIETEVVDIDALIDMGYSIDTDGNYYTINADGAKVQIEQEVQKPVTKVVDAEPIMKTATEATLVKVAGQDYATDSTSINKGNSQQFDFEEPTSNIEIALNLSTSSAQISFYDVNGDTIGSVSSQGNSTKGYTVPEGAVGVEVKNTSSGLFGKSIEVESIKYRGPAQEIEVEAGGEVPDYEAMEAAGIFWTDTVDMHDSQTPAYVSSTNNGDLHNIGNVGKDNVKGFNPEHSENSKVFNFGIDKAFEKVTINVDVEVKGSWDFNTNSTKDIFTVSANGNPIKTYNYTSSNTDYNNAITLGQDVEKTGNHAYSYEVYLDENGQVTMNFMVASTATEEIVNVKNIEVSYEGKTGYMQTVTELQTYTEIIFVDAPSEQIDPSTIVIPMKTVVQYEEIEKLTDPIIQTVSEVIGYTYTLDMSAILGDADGSESLSSITLANIPESAILKDAQGNELSAQSDGSYVITIDEEAEASITLTSDSELDSTTLSNITASISAIESNGDDSSTVSANEAGIVGVEGGAGDDTIAFDSDAVYTDGKAGYDTLLLAGDENIDFGSLSDKISNIEKIELGEGTQTVTLSLEDVLDMTTAENTLRIDGDESDTVYLKDAGESVEADGYREYTSGEGDSTVTLQISTTIHIEES